MATAPTRNTKVLQMCQPWLHFKMVSDVHPRVVPSGLSDMTGAKCPWVWVGARARTCGRARAYACTYVRTRTQRISHSPVVSGAVPYTILNYVQSPGGGPLTPPAPLWGAASLGVGGVCSGRHSFWFPGAHRCSPLWANGRFFLVFFCSGVQAQYKLSAYAHK